MLPPPAKLPRDSCHNQHCRVWLADSGTGSDPSAQRHRPAASASEITEVGPQVGEAVGASGDTFPRDSATGLRQLCTTQSSKTHDLNCLAKVYRVPCRSERPPLTRRKIRTSPPS